MPEAVIISTARTPIGRAFKGSLIEMRHDDLAAIVVQAALAKVPNLDPALVEDLIIGCAQPAGEQGYNIGRVVSLLNGLPDVPGTTVNRYCSSSLQTIRMAAHAIKAGEGDCFIAAGIECVSRFGLGRADGLENTGQVENRRDADAECQNDSSQTEPANERISHETTSQFWVRRPNSTESGLGSQGFLWQSG